MKNIANVMMKPGYAFQSSKRYPVDPDTVMVGDTECKECRYNGTAMIDDRIHDRFKIKGKRRYYFQLAIW